MRGLARRWPLVWAASALFLCAPAEAAPKLRGKVNLNTATEAQLELLPGVGPVTAKKIVEARQKEPFRRIMEIVRVPGIGMKRFRALEPHLAVEGATDLERVASPGKKKATKREKARRRYRVIRPKQGPKIIDFRGARSARPPPRDDEASPLGHGKRP